MKTLNKVIEDIERCDYHDGDCRQCDGLKYLKIFQQNRDELHALIEDYRREIARYQEAVKNCEASENRFRKMEMELNDLRREFIEQMKNDPLTWDDISKMQGKPVWIEDLENNVSYWTIILSAGITGHGWCFSNTEKFFFNSGKGKEWEAYKKEKENEITG